MAITVITSICDTFKKELAMGSHLFKAAAGNTFKILLLKAAAAGAGTYGQATTNVGTPGTGAPTTSNVGTDESSDTSGNAQYSVGGFVMTPNADPTLDTGNHVAYVDWTTDPNWGPAASITACGAVLYNNSLSNAAVASYTFSADKISTTGTFTLVLPLPAFNTAILRWA